MDEFFKINIRVDSLTTFVRGGNTRFVVKGVDLESGECLVLLIRVEDIQTEEVAAQLAAEAWPHRFNLHLSFGVYEDGNFTNRMYSEVVVTDL